MANSARESTSTHAARSASPAIPPVATAISDPPLGDSQHAASPAPNAAVNSHLALSTKHSNLPKFELNGATALAEQRQHDAEMKERATPKTSPNPAKTALMTPAVGGMSRPSDAPPHQSSPLSREPVSATLDTTIVAEPMQIDSEPPNGQVATPSQEPPAGPSGGHDSLERSDSKKRPASPTSRNDDRSNKAFTYPPPPETELPSPIRNFSLPNAGIRSPSTKKHRCTHCGTEFTRHHNLKSHLLTHSQEKPYGCEQCNQRFRRLHDLKRHLKLHTGERPHTCNICGRKFARGDALARHNKGPGGCAGRRESAGGDDDYGDEDGDVDMDGHYAGDDSHEGLSNDEQMADDHRRQSEPNKRGRRMSSRVDPHGLKFRHSSTYPAMAPMSAGPRGDMPPPKSGSTSAPRDPPPQRHLSPYPSGTSFNAVHYNGPSSMYSHGGMTESPKPLSPGQTDQNRNMSDAPVGRNRSPSLATKLQQQHFGRSTGGGNTGGSTPPVSLPPVITHQPQLPSIAGLDPRFNGSSYPANSPSSYRPPVISTQHGTGSSGSPSTSSLHQSSGGSRREVLGGGSGSPQEEARLMEYVRSMETRLHEEKTMRVKEREERDSIIRMLQHEMDMLKSLNPQPASQQGHRSSH